MYKTRVDDMLIEMISPKVKEIEEKFSRGEGLTQEDIHTLLLKSQYNHINHLDKKLDEIAADNSKLRLDFEVRFAGLENGLEKRMSGLETKFAGLETKFASLETKFESAQVRMQQTIIATMKWYIGGAGVVLVLLKALDIFVK
jgi:DNA repair exonuclease SbcCD ATPase subunit